MSLKKKHQPADQSINQPADKTPALSPAAKSNPVRTVLSSLWSTASGWFCNIILIIWLLAAFLSLVWTPYPLLRQEKNHILQPPSASHLMGTDAAGADILSWLLKGSGTELLIVLLVTAVTFLLGCAGTALTVSSRSWVSQVSVVVIDTLMAVPTIVIAMIVAVPLGKSVAIVVIACSLAYSFTIMRIVRPQARLAARSDYVRAARWSGAGDWEVFRRHILPSIAPMMTVQLSECAGTAILAEIGLTYLGIGLPSDIPSWGHSLAASSQLIGVYPLTVIWSGLCATLVVAALILCGDQLRECLDPVTNPRLRSAVEAQS